MRDYYLEVMTPGDPCRHFVKLTAQGQQLCQQFKTEAVLGRNPLSTELASLINHAVNPPANSTVYAVAWDGSMEWSV